MSRRISWFLRHPAQTKYLLIVVLAMLAPMLIVGFCLYSVVFHLIAREMVFPEAIRQNLIPVVDQVNRLLSVSLPAVALAILVAALAISNRFAGPIERMERELDLVLQGDRTRRIRLRKKDDLKGVADRINRILGERL